MSDTTYNPADDNTDDIERALVGRRIVSIERTPERYVQRDWGDGIGDRATITLDDGTAVQLDGHEGCGGCTAGCYELDTLATIADVDNIITAVHFHNSPASDWDNGAGEGKYSIFVITGDKRINLATFEGDDGNGYYGSGYYITITRPEGN